MRHAAHPAFDKPLLQSNSRPSSGPSTPLAGPQHFSPVRTSSVQCAIGVSAAFILAIFLLRTAFTTATLHKAGSRVPGNQTETFLREKGPLYSHSSQRCRSPSSDESIPNLKHVATWEPRPKRSSECAVTVATQLSLDRLDQVRAQCSSWPYTLAAAVYIPLAVRRVHPEEPSLGGATLKKVKAQLAQLHEELAARAGGCSLEVSLFAEVVPQGDASGVGLYPFNAMRNRAMQMVKTQAVLLLDADFLVGSHLAAELGTKKGWAGALQQLELTPAIALPAFQVVGMAREGSTLGTTGAGQGVEAWGSPAAARAGKEGAVQAYRSGTLQEHRAAAQLGLGQCLPLEEWAVAEGYLHLQYTYGCEPNLLMLTEHVPWFDERFRGYGYDKLMEYVVMWHWGVAFSVHPRGYLIHQGCPSPGVNRTAQQQHSAVSEQLLAQVTEQLRRHHYYPVTAFGDKCLLRPRVQPRRRNVILRAP